MSMPQDPAKLGMSKIVEFGQQTHTHTHYFRVVNLSSSF